MPVSGVSPTKPLPMIEPHSDFDLHQLLVPTPTTDVSAARGSPSTSSGPSSDAGSFVIPERLSRSNSVYSFSRASFSSQLSGLTSMSLPQAESLAANITALPSARKAIKALSGAAEQIQLWTKKALKVLDNLDAEDDVEWAAAAGRDGLDETEKTISKFENLINVYVVSIEELQSRPDVVELRGEDFQAIVEQMEITLEGWENVRSDLKRIHEQVELAMEWEELWAKVLGDVGVEMDSLSQLVFEMEEKRHNAYLSQTQPPADQIVDLKELENFIEEPQRKAQNPEARYSLPPTFESSPLGSPVVENPQDDSSLLALFARMQPLRASLDFLPMRLSMFQNRADKLFPTACRELDEKRDRLERNWAELSKEADNLRRELSEDRWVIVFRNAGRQAQKMCESVERSVAKVQEALNEGYQRTNPPALAKRVESFEAKKMHYGPAIERVLSIVQKGLKDRLTVNGEILRLHKDLASRTRELADAMEDLEAQLEPVTAKHNARLRESISSIVSADRSFTSTTFAGTPGSSPASSVDLPTQRYEKPTSKYGLNGYSKPRAASTSRPSLTAKRSSLLPSNKRPVTPLSSVSTSTLPRRGVSPSPRPASVYRQGVYNPATVPAPSRNTTTPVSNKPRWSSTVRRNESTMAPTYRSVSATTPATIRKYTPRSISSTTALPLRSPLSREASSSPCPALPTPPTGRRDSQQFKSFAERIADPTPSSGLMDPVPYHRSRTATASNLPTIRSPSSLAVRNENKSTITSIPVARPPSSLSRSFGGRQSLPLRTASHAKSSSGSEQAFPDADFEPERANELEEDDQIGEPGSSPLSKKNITRPGSVQAMSQRGRRVSMLPVPVGSGRQSSLGHRLS